MPLRPNIRPTLRPLSHQAYRAQTPIVLANMRAVAPSSCSVGVAKTAPARMAVVPRAQPNSRSTLDVRAASRIRPLSRRTRERPRVGGLAGMEAVVNVGR
eukprot:363901-Chlamydomonas_euryale.AAC.29